ncbi:MAG TPA: hypothetical protein VHY34_11340 [Caulobacteraceae bacterium]|jgi:hypothetical protein|nr:hypothetical protein [Caulobacteraceae bacterium]
MRTDISRAFKPHGSLLAQRGSGDELGTHQGGQLRPVCDQRHRLPCKGGLLNASEKH